MDSTSAPAWEQQRHAPIRARGAEDGGGAPGPSTVKGEICDGWYQKKKTNCVSLPPHAGPGDAPIFFSVVLCWHNVKMYEVFSLHRGPVCTHAGPGDAPKGASPGLGGGADSLFLCRIVLAKR